MKLYSPLRYPGGKSRLADFLARVCVQNNVNGHYIEPYAGGAAVALYLLLDGHVAEITINDKDRSIYAFWYSVLHHNKDLCGLISKTRVNVSSWHKQREIQRRKNNASLLELGFSTFFLNRTNISGIIDAGPIGGIHQEGNYKINCRFNKKRLIKCIQAIGKFKDQIHVSKLDALDLIEDIKNSSNGSNKIFYFDPPYYLKGESLYLNAYTPEDHKKVASEIKKIRNAHWIVTYDNVSPIRRLYKSYRAKRYNLRHTAHTSRMGKEIMFLSRGLIVPRVVIR